MAQPIVLNRFVSALLPRSHELICLVGGGGKSTLLFALGRGLRGEVILTTTTRMGVKQTNGVPTLERPSDSQLTAALARDGRILVRDRTEPGLGRRHGKAVGPAPEVVDHWFDLADHVVVEADGSRQLPFKAPGPHEPQLPQRVTTVLALIGADALGRCIGDQCFRPLRVAAVAKCGPYDRLTPERAARVLVSRRGSRQGVPDNARFVVVVNKVNALNESLVVETADRVAKARVEVFTVAETI